MELVSPALAGGFFTTELLGKSLATLSMFQFLSGYWYFRYNLLQTFAFNLHDTGFLQSFSCFSESLLVKLFFIPHIY